MKIGIIGSGVVGQTLGKAFATLGYEVKIGTRKPNGDSFAAVAAFGDVVVLATSWSGAENAVTLAGAKNLAGKVVIDVTNPLAPAPNGPPTLAVGGADSAGERVQRWLPQSKVVKAFNCVGNAHMFRPQFAGGPPDMFIAGNDAGAKQRVTDILTSFGWSTIDLGGIDASRYLEALAMIWILYGFRTNTWNHAFKLLRK
jgi:8-hydroxy-5-deazaflavin:NADPH oxidoreductase